MSIVCSLSSYLPLSNIYSRSLSLYHPTPVPPRVALSANQNGQYQQQDGQMIYGVPGQQEGGNPLGDPLQVHTVHGPWALTTSSVTHMDYSHLSMFFCNRYTHGSTDVQ